MVTSRDQPVKGCGEARQYADLAFSLACKCNKTLTELHQQIKKKTSQLCARRPTGSTRQRWRGGGRVAGEVSIAH